MYSSVWICNLCTAVYGAVDCTAVYGAVDCTAVCGAVDCTAVYRAVNCTAVYGAVDCTAVYHRSVDIGPVAREGGIERDMVGRKKEVKRLGKQIVSDINN